MHYAARARRTTVLKMLLQAGGEVNAKNARGHTPLDWATAGEVCGGGGGKGACLAILEEAGGVASITREEGSVWDTYCNDRGDVGSENKFKAWLEGELKEVKDCIDGGGDEEGMPFAEEWGGLGGGGVHRAGAFSRMEET